MDDREKQIPPPKSWTTFEDLCHSLFKSVWRDPLAQKHGRKGQAQHGVDIFGSPNGIYHVFHGVQCKGKNIQYGKEPTLEELQTELGKAQAFDPPLSHWVFATTAPVDSVIQQAARQISSERKQKGRFTVSVLGWDAILDLLCEHKQVLAEFYPGLGVDFPELLKNLHAMPQASEVNALIKTTRHMGSLRQAVSRANSEWRAVAFGGGRGVGPALMGRSLGPEDAVACPRLQEADLAVRDLQSAYSVRIVGEPGAGKSICAYQAALSFSRDGWQVYRLTDPGSEDVHLDCGTPGQRAVFIIDDAHLMKGEVLRVVEDAAGPERLLLSTHNAIKHDASSRGAIVIDAIGAVRTIASAFRREPEGLLEEIRRIDNQIGELPSDVSLENRIAHAEESAKYPWQFCFIVGGGWRRASAAANAARSVQADIVLAGIAIHQIASRDARPSLSKLSALLEFVDVARGEFLSSLQWLIQNRLVIGSHDLRCPHQRFSLVVLKNILMGQNATGRERIGQLLQNVVANSKFPIAGLRFLLHELRFFGYPRQWSYLIPEESLESLIGRCWMATSPEERTYACLLFGEIDAYVTGWPRMFFRGNERTISQWISKPDEPSGYGLARLIHAVRNKDPEFATILVEASSAKGLADAISGVSSTTAYNLGELIGALHVNPDSKWGRTFVDGVDRQKLIAASTSWPVSKKVWAFSNFCRSFSYFDETLALDMFECFIPNAQKCVFNDPLSGFGELRDIVSDVLRMLDVLGIYIGKAGPKARHRELARKFLEQVKPVRLAEQLSSSKIRDFQNLGMLLAFMAQAAPRKYRATIEAMNWPTIGETIGDHWKNLPHDAEVLLGVASQNQSGREKVAEIIRKNLYRIEAFPPRLVLIAPCVAYEHARKGGVIRLAQHDHVDWRFGAGAIALIADMDHNIVANVLAPWEGITGRVFSREHTSWYREAFEYVSLLREIAPTNLQRILDAVDVAGAQKGWTMGLRGTGGSQKTVALLVESSLERSDDLGVLARRLRTQFPKASVPRQPS